MVRNGLAGRELGHEATLRARYSDMYALAPAKTPRAPCNTIDSLRLTVAIVHARSLNDSSRRPAALGFRVVAIVDRRHVKLKAREARLLHESLQQHLVEQREQLALRWREAEMVTGSGKLRRVWTLLTKERENVRQKLQSSLGVDLFPTRPQTAGATAEDLSFWTETMQLTPYRLLFGEGGNIAMESRCSSSDAAAAEKTSSQHAATRHRPTRAFELVSDDLPVSGITPSLGWPEGLVDQLSKYEHLHDAMRAVSSGQHLLGSGTLAGLLATDAFFPERPPLRLAASMLRDLAAQQRPCVDAIQSVLAALAAIEVSAKPALVPDAPAVGWETLLVAMGGHAMAGFLTRSEIDAMRPHRPTPARPPADELAGLHLGLMIRERCCLSEGAELCFSPPLIGLASTCKAMRLPLLIAYMWEKALVRRPSGLGVLVATASHMGSAAIVVAISPRAHATVREVLQVGQVIESIGGRPASSVAGTLLATGGLPFGTVTLRVRLPVEIVEDGCDEVSLASSVAKFDVMASTGVKTPHQADPDGDLGVIAEQLAGGVARQIARRVVLGEGRQAGDQARTHWPVCWCMPAARECALSVDAFGICKACDGFEALPGVIHQLIELGFPADSVGYSRATAPCVFGCSPGTEHDSLVVPTIGHVPFGQVMALRAALGAPVLFTRAKEVGHLVRLSDLIHQRLAGYEIARGNVTPFATRAPRSKVFHVHFAFLADGATVGGDGLLGIGAKLADSVRTHQERLFLLGRSGFMSTIKAWLGEHQMSLLDPIVSEQLLEAFNLTFRPFGSEGAGVRLAAYLDASDRKMIWILLALGGGGCNHRSPSHAVPIGTHFDLVVRDEVFRRSRWDVVSSIMAAREFTELELAQGTLSQLQYQTLNQKRGALFGDLAKRTLGQSNALPIGCTLPPPATQAAGAQPGAASPQPDGQAFEHRSLRSIFASATVVVAALHDFKKNMSKAYVDAILDNAGEPSGASGPQGEVLSVQGGKGAAQETINSNIKAATGKKKFDLGIRGCEYRKVFLHYRNVFGGHTSEFVLQLAELHDLTLYLASRPLLETGGWKVAEYAIIGSVSLSVALRLRSDSLATAEMAPLSQFTALNMLPIMRRCLGLSGISSCHEEDAEGEFAKDKDATKRVNMSGAGSAYQMASNVAMQYQSAPKVKLLDSERVDAVRAPIMLRFEACFINMTERSLYNFVTALTDDRLHPDEAAYLRLGPVADVLAGAPARWLDVCEVQLDKESDSVPDNVKVYTLCGCDTPGPHRLMHRLRADHPAAELTCEGACCSRFRPRPGFAGSPKTPRFHTMCACPQTAPAGAMPAPAAAATEEMSAWDGLLVIVADPQLLSVEHAPVQATATLTVTQGSRTPVWLWASSEVQVQLKASDAIVTLICVEDPTVKLVPRVPMLVLLEFKAQGSTLLSVLHSHDGSRLASRRVSTSASTPLSPLGPVARDIFKARMGAGHDIPRYMELLLDATPEAVARREKVDAFIAEGALPGTAGRQVFDVPVTCSSKCASCSSNRVSPAGCWVRRCKSCCAKLHGGHACKAHSQGGSKAGSAKTKRSGGPLSSRASGKRAKRGGPRGSKASGVGPAAKKSKGPDGPVPRQPALKKAKKVSARAEATALVGRKVSKQFAGFGLFSGSIEHYYPRLKCARFPGKLDPALVLCCS